MLSPCNIAWKAGAVIGPLLPRGGGRGRGGREGGGGGKGQGGGKGGGEGGWERGLAPGHEGLGNTGLALH